MIAKGAGIPLSLVILSSIFAMLLYLMYGGFFVYLSLAFVLLTLFFIIFFRDPERTNAEGILSPADGRVDELKKKRIEVFMNITDVHVNRSPVSGKIASIKYIPGKHRPAFSSSTGSNERLKIKIESEDKEIVLTQVAGVFARRIVPYVKEGDFVQKGDRIGMIRFGSRVILEFSLDVDFSVERGQKVKAAETSLGVWK